MDSNKRTDAPLVSVVVPVYKVEAYLDRCLTSVAHQTYTNWEMILVDDGSPDACGAICDRWAAGDPRIQVIHQKNGGLSAARNSGARKARGEWLVFLDSDDWWESSFLEEMLRALQETDTRLCLCGWALDYEDDPAQNSVLIPRAGIFSPRELLGRILEEGGAVYVTAWNRLIQRSLWGQLVFPEGKIHEDEFTVVQILELTDRICVLDRPLYHYVQRQGSITNAAPTPRRWDRVEALLLRYQAYRERHYTELEAPMLRSLMHHYLICLQASRREAAEDARLDSIRHQMAVLKQDKGIWNSLSLGEKLAVDRPRIWRSLYGIKQAGKQRNQA